MTESSATVIYLDWTMRPTTDRANAMLVKVLFEDGQTAWLTPPEAPESEPEPPETA